MKEKISINLYIAEHRFPLSVPREQEEVVRKAAKLLNDRLAKRKNVGYEGSKLFALVALELLAEELEQNKLAGKDTIEKELEDIRMMLEDSIV